MACLERGCFTSRAQPVARCAIVPCGSLVPQCLARSQSGRPIQHMKACFVRAACRFSLRLDAARTWTCVAVFQCLPCRRLSRSASRSPCPVLAGLGEDPGAQWWSCTGLTRQTSCGPRIRGFQESLETSGARDSFSENPPGLGDEYSVCAALQAAGGACLRNLACDVKLFAYVWFLDNGLGVNSSSGTDRNTTQLAPECCILRASMGVAICVDRRDHR